jgi:response regulator RpfG family c-di-GMP phosphodiesterase
MSNTILIVDDEVEIASAVQDYLTQQGYIVLVATGPKEALEIIGKNTISLIVSDIKMAGGTGIDLFHEYKQKIDIENKTPFVLMTGYADTISVQNAFAIGVDELISKPFDLEAVRLVIDYLLDSKRAIGADQDKYFSIPIEDFMLSKTSDYTVFLRVDDKYVRVTKSGQDFTSQRLENFARKGVTHIYLNANDFAKYTDLQFAISKIIHSRPLDITKKTKIMNQLMSSVSQSSLLNKIDKNFLEKSVNAFEAYTTVSLNNSQINNILAYLMLENPDLAQQSTLKAIISCSVASAWKWNSPKVQSRIILSALLSDVGLKDLHQLMQKKRFEYTAEEVKTYEQHPFTSYQILNQIEHIPEEILFVALQHHENSAGLGFPQKLVRSKTHAFSKLIHAVGEFVETLLQQEDPSNIQQALDHIYNIQGKIVSEQVIKTLYIIFKAKLPKPLEGLLLPTETTRVA